MPTWVALLRGINVSGQKPVPMQRLREVFESLKFREVKTHVQSGNVVFQATAAQAEKIEKAIEAEFGFAVPVILRTAAEWRKMAKANPFLARKGVEEAALYVTLPATETKVKVLEPPAGCADELAIKGQEVYLYCPGGYGKTKLSNTFLEKKLGVTATTRNWKTVSALLALLAD